MEVKFAELEQAELSAVGERCRPRRCWVSVPLAQHARVAVGESLASAAMAFGGHRHH